MSDCHIDLSSWIYAMQTYTTLEEYQLLRGDHKKPEATVLIQVSDSPFLGDKLRISHPQRHLFFALLRVGI